MGKVRYKSRAVALTEKVPQTEISVDGYLMVSRDNGNTYDSVFDENDKEVEEFAKDLFIKEEY